MPDNDYEELRADFEALKAALAASVASQDPAELDRVTASVLELDEPTIRREITRRYASARIKRRMEAIEKRLNSLRGRQDG